VAAGPTGVTRKKAVPGDKARKRLLLHWTSDYQGHPGEGGSEGAVRAEDEAAPPVRAQCGARKALAHKKPPHLRVAGWFGRSTFCGHQSVSSVPIVTPAILTPDELMERVI
jgi:hypothetical protein